MKVVEKLSLDSGKINWLKRRGSPARSGEERSEEMRMQELIFRLTEMNMDHEVLLKDVPALRSRTQQIENIHNVSRSKLV